jgi:tetratricopeptide (TPR) repeat protein
MRCSTCQKLYDNAVEDALSERLARKVREHVAQCPACSVVWQENDGLRQILRASAVPPSVPDSEYFARLARQVVAQAQTRPAFADPSPGWFEKLAGVFHGEGFGMVRLAQGLALLAIGLIGGFILSPNIRTQAHGAVFAPPRIASPVGNLLGPRNEPTISVAANETVSEPGPIMKVPEAAATGVDPALLVQTWKTTVDLLDKMAPSEEVERLRQIQRVSREVRAAAVLTRLQDLKDELLRSGQTAYIPDVHRIEEVFSRLASASRETQAADFAHLDTYQKAEQALIEKRYDDAMRLFQMVVLQARGSYLAARATYQMGNINYEYFRDYKNAFIDYTRCMEEFPGQFLPDAVQNQIHERMDMITQNSMDHYAPLRTFHKAESTSKPAAAIPLYSAILKQYPQSPLVRPSIEAMTRLARQAADDTSSVNQVLEALDQFQDQNPGHLCEMAAQLGVADVTNYCVRNRSQAVLEYTKILEKAKDPTLVKTAQERLRMLEKGR